MNRVWAPLAGATALLTAWSAGATAGGARPDVLDTPLTTVPGDPARGRQVVLDRALSACLLCHTGPFPAPHLHGGIGPTLEGVAERLSPAQIRLRLVDSRRVNPDTVMPPYFVTTGLTRVGAAWSGRPVLSAQQIEDVVAFLATLTTPSLGSPTPALGTP